MPNRISFSPVTGEFVDPAYPIDDVFDVELVELEQEDTGVLESVELLAKSGISGDYIPPESNGYLLHFEEGKRRFICPRGPMADWMIQWLVSMLESLGTELFDATGIVGYGADTASGRMWLEVDWYADHYMPWFPKEKNVSVFEQYLTQTTAMVDRLGASGAVHGAIRPASFLARTGTEQLRLAEFGLGIMIAAQREAVFSGLGTSLGDPQTMAPEVVAGALPTNQSDYYALGVSLLMATGLVDGLRRTDPYMGTEAIAARECLTVSDWVARNIASEERERLEQLLAPYLEADLEKRRIYSGKVGRSVAPPAGQASLFQRLRGLFRREPRAEVKPDAVPSDETEAPKPPLVVPKKLIAVAVILLAPLFGAGFFVSLKFRKPALLHAAHSASASSAHGQHSPSSSLSAHRFRHGKKGDREAQAAASSSSAPLLNLDPAACKKDLESLSKRVEADLQFWGEQSELIACSPRDGRSWCCDSLHRLHSCATILNRQVGIEVASSDEKLLQSRMESMRKEASWCGMGLEAVQGSTREGGKRAVRVQVSGKNGK